MRGVKNKHSAQTPHDLGALNAAWDGFTLRGGIIYTPGNYAVQPGDLNCIEIRLQQIANYKALLRRPEQMLL